MKVRATLLQSELKIGHKSERQKSDKHRNNRCREAPVVHHLEKARHAD